jgi:hypothetical protein
LIFTPPTKKENIMSLLKQLGPKTTTLPPRGVIAGVPGIGKTTFVCSSVRPAVIACETGLVGLEHVPQFEPAGYKDVLAFLDECIGSETVPFETLAVDTLDALEAMIYRAVIEEANSPKIKAIEDVGGGYGKGYMRGRELLEGVLQRLDIINKKHQVAIWITSHTSVKTSKQPDGLEFNYWGLKGNEKFNNIVLAWADMVLFANYRMYQSGDKKDKKAIGGDRYLFTEKTPQWEAKNRYGLPPEIPLDWQTFAKEMAAVHRPTLEERAKSLIAGSVLPNEKRVAMIAEIPTLTPDRLRKMIAFLQLNQDELP